MNSSTNCIDIILDYREKDLIKLLPHCIVKNLDLGDIHFIHSNTNTIECIIERKTMHDLESSITDGRAKEQKLRLLHFCKENNIKLIYLIEGDIYERSKSMLMSSIINKIVRDNIFVLRSKNLSESSEFILKLQSKFSLFNIESNKNKNNEITEYTSVIKPKKSDNLNPRNVYIMQLMCIPKISNTIAIAIVNKYPTIQELFNNIDNISEIEYELKTRDKNENLKKRKIGKVVQQNIVYFFNHSK